MMIFVNYGGGGYYFFDHAPWNGLTFADLLFPWFVWIMGTSMAISMKGIHSDKTLRAACEAKLTQHSPAITNNQPHSIRIPSAKGVWYKIIRRSVILFALGLFLNASNNLATYRIPGVLQYFAIANLVIAGTIVALREATCTRLLEFERACEKSGLVVDNRLSKIEDSSENMTENQNFCSDLLNSLDPRHSILWCYAYEYAVVASLWLTYVLICLFAKAPGCPRGYMGPGGIGNGGDYPGCTGGIHRYIDVSIFGEDHIYDDPTCSSIYNCVSYDPEGLLGSLTACTLTYLGVWTGRVLVHYQAYNDRLRLWLRMGTFLPLSGCVSVRLYPERRSHSYQ